MGRDALATALRERIVTGIHVGRYAGGERLPSVRALATEYDVNERVVLAALHQLEAEGFIRLRPRSGAYVEPPRQAGTDSLPQIGNWLVGMLVQGRSRGVAPRGMGELLRRCFESRRVRAACIECNNDQRHLLCSELANDHGFVTESTPLEALSEPALPSSLRHADLLVTTAFHAPQVRRVAKLLGKPCISVELRADVMRDVGRWLQAGTVYYVATDPRYERKLRRMLAAVGPVANLQYLLADRDDLGAIPSTAPTFVMPSARDAVRKRFGDRGGPGRPIHPMHYFSDGSARELLTFLVRANLAPSATR